MIVNRRHISCIIAGLILLSLLIPGKAWAKRDGRVVYLAYNLRYDPAAMRASIINYQDNLFIPAGIRITILSYSRNRIRILTENGEKIDMEYSKRYTGLDTADWILKMTTPNDPKPEWERKFSETELKGIQFGKAFSGMSKDAVIVALGYPPKHRTFSTDLDRWTYWASRVITFSIEFQGGSVSRIGFAGR